MREITPWLHLPGAGSGAWPDNSSDDSSTATQIQTNQRLNGPVCTQREIIDFNLTTFISYSKVKTVS